jgi:antitoxin MazE
MHLVKIGNSYGIRIPKALIEQCHLNDTELELLVTKNGLLVKPLIAVRADWEKQFKQAAKENLSDSDFVSNQFDTDEWEWPTK